VREQDFSFAMVPLKRITVRDRSRQDMGDLDGLTLSIKELGLLNPITVTSDFHLVAGQRRLEACRRLGWDEVPAHVVHHFAADSVIAVLAEVAENDKRKGLTTSERNIATARRMTLAAKLREEGHSLRSIAETVGVSKSQVAKDIDQVSTSGQLNEPEFITGADGKTYPATRPEIVPGGADDSDAPGLARVEPVPQDEASTPPGTTIDPETGEIVVHDEPAPAEHETTTSLRQLKDSMKSPEQRDRDAIEAAALKVCEGFLIHDPVRIADIGTPDTYDSMDRLEQRMTDWFRRHREARPTTRLKAVR